MSSNMYLVVGCFGAYEDKQYHNFRVYRNRASAEVEVDRLKCKLEKYKDIDNALRLAAEGFYPQPEHPAWKATQKRYDLAAESGFYDRMEADFCKLDNHVNVSNISFWIDEVPCDD